MPDDFIDEDAEELDPNNCLMYIVNNEVKDIEQDFFSFVELESALYFGGSLGAKSGGVTALAISPNGRLIAIAITGGAILVYDTMNFDLVRIYAQ